MLGSQHTQLQGCRKKLANILIKTQYKTGDTNLAQLGC